MTPQNLELVAGRFDTYKTKQPVPYFNINKVGDETMVKIIHFSN